VIASVKVPTFVSPLQHALFPPAPENAPRLPCWRVLRGGPAPFHENRYNPDRRSLEGQGNVGSGCTWAIAASSSAASSRI
jgi:hypothetical protein